MPETCSVIAIDGPAASGKSSVAREVARKLGWSYVNTGNMYRAATWAVVQAGLDPSDMDKVNALLATVNFSLEVVDGASVILIDRLNVEDELNSEAINAAVSLVARIPEVRDRLVAMQRQMGRSRPTVMEGRDIGTVVFPDATTKFYIDASEEIRMARRGLQGQADAVRERDRIDSTRKVAPLVAAADAVVIDSSELTLEQVVDQVMKLLKDRCIIPAA
jgi:CMP/dCMP kinase